MTANDHLLQLQRTDLLKYYRSSPYHLGAKLNAASKSAAAAAPGADDIERYADRFARKPRKQEGPPLQSMLTLNPWHFPEELFTDRDKRLAARGSKSADLFAKHKPAAPEDAEALTKRFDRLTQAEQAGRGGAGPGARAGQAGAAAAGAAGAAGAEGGPPAPEEDDAAGAGYDEDDDDVMEEDDYYQGEYYDDDEGYDDGYEDGGDDGAVY